MAVTRQVLDEVARQHGVLDRIHDEQTRTMARRWVEVWRRVDRDLQTEALAIAQLGDDAGVSHIIRRTKASQAAAMIASHLSELLAQCADDAARQAVELISQADDDQHTLLAAQLPAGLAGALLRADSGQLDEIGRRTRQQITIRHWYLNRLATEQMKQALIESVAVGTNPADAAAAMVRRVQGAFEGGLARAVVIARTEQLDAYRQASHATWQANRHVMAGWMWCATLTGRTCPSCLAMHGSIHPLDEPGPLDHHQGRCTGVPVTRTWADLGFVGVDEPPGQVRPGDGVRWLQAQPPDVQERILGPKRYAAWLDGRYPPQDWSERRTHWSVDEHGRPRQDWRDSYHVGPVH